VSWLLDIHKAFNHGGLREHSPYHPLYFGKALPDNASGLFRVGERKALTGSMHSDPTGWV